MKLVISDAHEGLKGAITRVMGATGQRPLGALHAQCPVLCACGPEHLSSPPRSAVPSCSPINRKHHRRSGDRSRLVAHPLAQVGACMDEAGNRRARLHRLS
ncbi:hypothetical protein [Novosphingobium sp.]|uniref:hypothetical protein n=1 Tax=Novosphingobium sp. TaxID=1874826 RepID=UPI003444FFB4